MLAPSRLDEDFLRLIPEELRAQWRNLPGLQDALLSAWSTARVAWLHVELAAPIFAQHLAERWPRDQAPDLRFSALNTGDLYLAAACLHRCPNAVASFEAAYLSQLPSILSTLRLTPAMVADVGQELARRLFTAPEDELPKIAEYAGRGALLMWVRAAALRLALNQLDNAAVRKQAADVDVDKLLDTGRANNNAERTGPDLAFIKNHDRALVRECLQSVLGALSKEHRTLLRLYFLDGLTVEEIGKIYKLNKSTVSRRLTEVRRLLGSQMRQELARRLKLRPSEIDSLVDLVCSQLNLSLPGLLRTSDD
jgi:RNA polymerase sigma-70 factor